MSEQNQSNSEHDRLISRLLSSRKKAEALKWLKASKEDERTIGACETNADSIKLVETLYKAGALEVLAVRIHKILNGNGHRTGKLVVKLPQKAELRKVIFDWCKQQGDSLGFTPDPDRGENYLYLLFD